MTIKKYRKMTHPKILSQAIRYALGMRVYRSLVVGYIEIEEQ